MNAKKRGLGRGLDALLSSDVKSEALLDDGGDSLKIIDIELIERGRYQPRIKIEKEPLDELVQSISQYGVLQPVVVRRLKGKHGFELIAGERRWRASQLAGLRSLPAVIKEIDDHDAMSVALIENIQREQLNPIEEALALARLVSEFNMTHEKVAISIGKSRATVSNLIRLLDLEKRSRELLEDGALEMGHARALLGITGSPQVELAERIAIENLSVRAVERLLKKHRAKREVKISDDPELDPNVTSLEGTLSGRIGAHVSINHDKSGSGKVVISYNSLAELEGILDHIKQ